MRVEYDIPRSEKHDDFEWRQRVLGTHIAWTSVGLSPIITVWVENLSEEEAILIRLKYLNVTVDKDLQYK